MMEQQLFEHIPNPTLVYDRDSLRILKANASFRKKYQYTPEEISSGELSIRDIHRASDFSEVEQYLKNHTNGTVQPSGIWQHQSKAGETFRVNPVARSFRYNDEPAGIISLNEVPEPKPGSAEKKDGKISENDKNLFEKLFVNAPQAIILVDTENIVLRVNNSFEHLFGYSADELLGNDLNNVLKAGEGYEKAPKITDSDLTKSQIYTELTRYTKNGEPLNVVLGGIPIYNNGELVAGFGIYMDITGQKETQHKLQQLLDEKQVLIEEVHHRVKNNLGVISGLLQMQILHVDDERLTKYIRNSQLRIQSMAIVHEMLYKSEKLSQIKMDSYVQKLASVTSDSLSPDSKEIDTKVETDEIILNVNQAIPAALIVSELITNAYEYAFEGRQRGTVKVSLSRSVKAVSISVEDNGIGLPDDFEEMRKKSLGLTLVENLCHQLETEIEIESGDWGTKFRFSFQPNDAQGSSSSNRV